MANVFGIVLMLAALFAAWAIFNGFLTVDTAEAAIVQRFGKFLRVAHAGLNFKTPFVERVVYTIDLKVPQVVVSVTTKTKENVFVRIPARTRSWW